MSLPISPSLLASASTLCFVMALAGCTTRTPAPPPPPPAPPPTVAEAAPPTVTRGHFTIEAAPLDTWNAIGDIVVRTPEASYDGRSQILGVYSVNYRGQRLLVLAHGLPLSDTIHVLTTEVTAKSPAGVPVDSDAVADLLAVLQRELPAEIKGVRARQEAESAAAAQKAKSHKTKSRRVKSSKKR